MAFHKRDQTGVYFYIKDDKGCHGGKMDHAYQYIISNDGIDTERGYPYRAKVNEYDVFHVVKPRRPIKTNCEATKRS